ncbi:hypothetical protein [Peribacillus glennii]|uniref:hypothetical protein n=1 Tax=Peribacillus glennii TaxID=2303991 RepID=UPI0013141086|nr:hypothetical protein [Peribacillus glennii]
METKKCPECGGKLVEDVKEDIEFLQGGNMMIDVNMILTCNRRCGYWEELEQSEITGE